MYLREFPDIAIDDLVDMIDTDRAEKVVMRAEGIAFNIEGAPTPTVRLTGSEVSSGGDGGREVLLDDEGTKQFAQWLDIPFKFLQRQNDEMQQYLLTQIIGKRRDDLLTVEVLGDKVSAVTDPGRTVISPKRYVEVAKKVIAGSDTVVADFRCDADSFLLDVIPPEGFLRGISGDAKAGDLCHGGLRFTQNRSRNLAPQVSNFLYRRICTNGMVVPDPSLKVDARNLSSEGLVDSLEEIARRAFNDVEAAIEAFYDLRNEKVADPSQALLRLGEEAGLPSRTIMGLIERVPEYIDVTEDASMFDVVNLITNMANDPANRESTRHALQMAGGESVASHAARCRSCQSRLN